MKVYIAMGHEAYRSDWVISVHSTMEGAKTACEKEAREMDASGNLWASLKPEQGEVGSWNGNRTEWADKYGESPFSVESHDTDAEIG
jgi:hypothetical protein